VGFGQQYNKIRDKFFCFPISKAVLGVEFANLNDAVQFRKLIN